jgi:hypothetical protein
MDAELLSETFVELTDTMVAGFDRYSGSLTHCQPRVSSCAARTRKAPAASDNPATTRASWR